MERERGSITDASGNMLLDHPSGDSILPKHEKLKRLRRKRNTYPR